MKTIRSVEFSGPISAVRDGSKTQFRQVADEPFRVTVSGNVATFDPPRSRPHIDVGEIVHVDGTGIVIKIKEIVGERLQSVDAVAALSSGASALRTPRFYAEHFPEYAAAVFTHKGGKPPLAPSPLEVFRTGWDEIHTGPSRWDFNPWVWVYTFEVAV